MSGWKARLVRCVQCSAEYYINPGYTTWKQDTQGKWYCPGHPTPKLRERKSNQS